MKITHLLPIRNGGRHLSNIHASILPNVSNRDELLIVDNDSSDMTPRFLKDLSRNFSNVRVMTCRKGGLIESLNLGIKEADGTWIARYDLDDVYHPGRIQKQLGSLDQDIVGVFSDAHIINASGNSIAEIWSPITPEAIKLSLIRNRRTPHSSVLLHRESVIEAGSYRSQDYLAEDLSLWLRMLRIGRLSSVPEPLMNYRIHATSITSTNRKGMIDSREQIIRSLFDFSGFGSTNFTDKLEELIEGYKSSSFGIERSLLLLLEVSTLEEYVDLDWDARRVSRILRRTFNPKQILFSAFNLTSNESKRILSRRFFA